MTSRRKFFRVILGFFATLLTLKYSTIANTMKPRPYHHLPDGTFRNPPGSPIREITRSSHSRGFFHFFYKGIIKKEIFGQKEIPDNIPSDHKISEKKAIEFFYNNKDDISITWLGHASFLIKLGNINLLTDPFLSKTAGFLGIGPNRYIAPGIAIKNLPTINTILISHNHYDHLDVVTLKKIKNKSDITIVCPLRLSRTFINLGYKKVIELDWYDTQQIESSIITAVPTIHWSRRLGQKRNTTLWAGYVIHYMNKKIYFSGDTAFGPIFSEIGKKLGPFDLSLVSIGAYEPRDFMKASHCNPDEAAEITKMLGSNNILGMHWGTIRLSAEKAWEPPKKFKVKAKMLGYKDHQIWHLAIGQTKSLI